MAALGVEENPMNSDDNDDDSDHEDVCGGDSDMITHVRHAGMSVLLAAPPKVESSSDNDEEEDDDDDDSDDDMDDLEDVPVVDAAGTAMPSLARSAVASAGGITISVSAPTAATAADTATKQRAKVQREMSRLERRLHAETHKAHVLCLLAALVYKNRFCCDEGQIGAMVMSCAPKALVAAAPVSSPAGSDGQHEQQTLGRKRFVKLLKWFALTFACEPDDTAQSSEPNDDDVAMWCRTIEQTGRYCAPPWKSCLDGVNPVWRRLTLCVSRRAGSAEDLAVLFCALLRALGVRVRLVAALCPTPFRPCRPPKGKGSNRKRTRKDSQEGQTSAEAIVLDSDDDEANGARSGVKRKGTAHASGAAAASKRHRVSAASPLYGKARRNQVPDAVLCARTAWVEVMLKGQWTHVDPLLAVIDEPAEVVMPPEACYVVGIDNEGFVRDITARYCRNFASNAFRKRRAPDEWYAGALQPLSRALNEEDAAEDETTTKALVAEQVPQSFTALKDHAFYAVERHLKRNQVIYPKEAVAVCKGESVYPRSAVHTVRSREHWQKEARVVRPGEEPVKTVHTRGGSNNPAGSSTELFGPWQTEAYKPPAAIDGKVPKNQYGTVDMFKPCMLPRGCVWLREQGMANVAKALGVSYGHAVTGFDYHGGKMAPVKDGVVVCMEHEQLLNEAWTQTQVHQSEQQGKQRSRDAIKLWSRLVRRLLIRERVKVVTGGRNGWCAWVSFSKAFCE
eukprot:m.239992 g.239992  ORF g.239992 m.239992 type:complete len:735 (-) comp18985_c1_seq2:2450-4654(-)